MKKRAEVIVVGSLNIDYVATVERLPRSGETVPGLELVKRFGGKGANQAVAAARQGAQVTMIGCVGADEGGPAYQHRLRAEGIRVAGLSTAARALTGTALIAVDRKGENLIVVCPGANNELGPAAIRRFDPQIRVAQVLLVQWEVPLPTVLEAVRLANRAGVRVLMNPSPVRAGFPWSDCAVDVLIVNVAEAQALFSFNAANLALNLRACRRELGRRNIGGLLVTRGARPTVFISRSEYIEVPVLRVAPVDTVGAGDAFGGVLAARLAEGAEMADAIRYANCAGALTTLKLGAQEAIPTRHATERAVAALRAKSVAPVNKLLV